MSAKDVLAKRYHEAAWRLVHHAWRSMQQAGEITADTPAGRRFAAFGAGSTISFPAGSVVRGQIPDRCVVAGVPARVVREYSAGAGWARPSPVLGERA